MQSDGILIFLSATSIAIGIAGFVHAHYREKTMEFLNRCEHEKTRAEIDELRDAVPEPHRHGPRPIGFRPGA